MKIVVSSAVLVNELSQFDLENHPVEWAEVTFGMKGWHVLTLVMYRHYESISVNVHCDEDFGSFDQMSRDWNSIFKALRTIQEQPVTIEISDKYTTVTIGT